MVWGYATMIGLRRWLHRALVRGEQTWSHSREVLPTKAQGDAWQLADEVANRLGSCSARR
jgi:hypothetical protein